VGLLDERPTAECVGMVDPAAILDLNRNSLLAHGQDEDENLCKIVPTPVDLMDERPCALRVACPRAGDKSMGPTSASIVGLKLATVL
jgi:hypothetical protein